MEQWFKLCKSDEIGDLDDSWYKCFGPFLKEFESPQTPSPPVDGKVGQSLVCGLNRGVGEEKIYMKNNNNKTYKEFFLDEEKTLRFSKYIGTL